jgi:hypothetical protein
MQKHVKLFEEFVNESFFSKLLSKTSGKVAELVEFIKGDKPILVYTPGTKPYKGGEILGKLFKELPSKEYNALFKDGYKTVDCNKLEIEEIDSNEGDPDEDDDEMKDKTIEEVFYPDMSDPKNKDFATKIIIFQEFSGSYCRQEKQKEIIKMLDKRTKEGGALGKHGNKLFLTNDESLVKKLEDRFAVLTLDSKK